jgi:uncharacterized OB-fold protein
MEASVAQAGGSSVPVGVGQQYAERLARGRFDIQRCDACERHVFHPREICPHCGAARLKWVPASGDGVVHSFTIVRRREKDGGDYNVVLVDLAEGVRMMSRVVGGPADSVWIGMPVKAAIQRLNDAPAVVFTEHRT